ncbi:putative zinc finger protein [Monoraphidium neglectum]|uniref:Putative zinc finger protein n=1 Tax=Monoraphidium neglectum TaxID=145388 RepID=A0A0D2KCU4_9CHLO|nr:putative zinc finger protein [Monoraphidium neglectum]KIY93628.1 putative zinc finger protein [Monoraphidium neglectum]|eukprot:XP_013892648.1 putative zinc finger protein [Monoraphidium neglectum]
MGADGKVQICYDFTKGMCTRGDKCKYSHDIATIVHFNSREKGICFDYLRNQCHRGLLCRFSHDLSNIAQQCQLVC